MKKIQYTSDVVKPSYDNLASLFPLMLEWAEEMGYPEWKIAFKDAYWIKSPGIYFVIVKEGIEVVALLALNLVTNNILERSGLEEDSLYVRKAWRGNKISGILIHKAYELAKEKDCAYIQISPKRDGGDPAIASNIMTQHGFKIHGYIMRMEV